MTTTAIRIGQTKNITADRLLGRSTTGTGAAEEIQIGTGLTLAMGILSSGQAATSVYNETITADGINLTYYLTNYAAPGTIRVWINGIRQPASDDIAPTDTVTFTTLPSAGDLLIFDYEMDQS